MVNTVAQYLRPFQWNTRRSSLSSLSETKKISQQRRNSSGSLAHTNQLQQQQNNGFPTLPNLSNQRRRFSLGSEIYNYGTPVTVIRKNSSVIECVVDEDKKRKKSRFLTYSIVCLIFIVVVLGIFGLITSKALPKPNSYCIGEHFCIPVKTSTEKVKMNLSAIKEKVDSEVVYKAKLKDLNEHRRNLIPRVIPRVIGKVEPAPPKQTDKFYQNPDDKFVESVNDVVRMKTPSPFMPREANMKERSHNVWQREWQNQWDNRRIRAPPGVNPKIYLRNEL